MRLCVLTIYLLTYSEVLNKHEYLTAGFFWNWCNIDPNQNCKTQLCLFLSGKTRSSVWNVQFVSRQLILFQFINVWMGTLFAKIVTQSWRIVQFAEMTSITIWRSEIGNLRKSSKGTVLFHGILWAGLLEGSFDIDFFQRMAFGSFFK